MVMQMRGRGLFTHVQFVWVIAWSSHRENMSSVEKLLYLHIWYRWMWNFVGNYILKIRKNLLRGKIIICKLVVETLGFYNLTYI